MPKVSVVIPTYNRADMLGDAVDSVLKQSYGDWEVVVVDDGSTDDTRALMSRYAATDARIRYVYQPNKGLSGARNTGILEAHGELVALLDSDDLCLPDRLREQVSVFETRPQTGLVAGGHIVVDERLNVVAEHPAWKLQPSLTLLDLLTTCPFYPSTVMARRSWFLEAGLFDEAMRRVEDWDMWLRMSHAGCTMAWVESPVSYYRLHGANMMRDAVLMREGILTMLDKMYARPGLAGEVLTLKDRAYASAYLDGAGRAFAAGLGEEGKTCLTRAIELNPELGRGDPPDALLTMASFARLPFVHDPAAFMEAVRTHLPENLPMRQWSKRRAWASFQAVSAFDRHRHGRRASAAGHAAAAVWNDPAWTRNAGLVAILVKDGLRGAAGKVRRTLIRPSRRDSANTMISKATWDAQYSSGQWHWLRDTSELARYSVLVGYVKTLKASPTVLDLGCGEGILEEHLSDPGTGVKAYASYTGVDVSVEAIARANLRQGTRTSFACADVKTYQPDRPFDIVVFNELLYYMSDPLGLLRHYEPYLAPDGSFIVSMYEAEQTRGIWPGLDREYMTLDSTVITNRNNTSWTIKVYKAHSVQRSLPA